KVTVTNIGTQSSRTLTTDDRGFYSADNLPVGTYSVQVEQPGFRTEAQSGLALSADARATADFHLQVGNLSQTVDVSAQSVQLNTMSGEVAHVIDTRQVENLPLNGRNYMQL